MVGTRCAVFGCDHVSPSPYDVSFFSFPKDEELKRKWIVALGRPPDWIPAVSLKVCSVHFSQNMFVPGLGTSETPKREGRTKRVRKTLKRGVIPNILDPPAFKMTKLSDIGLQASCSSSKDDNTENPEQYTENFKMENIELLSNIEDSSAQYILPTVEHSYFSKVITKGIDERIKIPTRDFGIQYDINDISWEVRRSNSESSRLFDVPDLQKIEIKSGEMVSKDIYSLASLSRIATGESEDQFSDCSYEQSRDGCQKNYSESDESLAEDEEEFPSNGTPDQEDKYIIFASNLLLLFKICHVCHQKPVKNITRKVFGTGLRITTECSDGCRFSWESQPKFNATWWGNYLLAASLFYSEALPAKFLSLVKYFKLKMFSTSVYFKLQRLFHPIIEKVYLCEREKLLNASLSEPVVICGDGRAYCLDHSGNCGLYACIEGKSRRILHVELVQSSEVTNLNEMEVEGLKRALNCLKSFGIVVSKLVTDKQPSVIAYARDNLPDVSHESDIWHVCKNIKSKLTAIAKMKGNEILNPWIPEIISHVYWIANDSISIVDRLDKWTSITNRLCNIHERPFKTYSEMSPDETRVFVERDSELYRSISKIVNSSSTLAAIANLSTDYRTYSFEVFHSVLKSFCDERVCFEKDSFKSRVYLAVMHFNENAHKREVMNEHCEEVKFLSHHKAKDGASATQNLLKETTFEYVESLMRATYRNANPEKGGKKFPSY